MQGKGNDLNNLTTALSKQRLQRKFKKKLTFPQKIQQKNPQIFLHFNGRNGLYYSP